MITQKSNLNLALLATVALLPLGLYAAPLPMHHAPQPPQASTLPPPHLVGSDATRLKRPYGGTPIDVTTYHYDQNRTAGIPLKPT